MGDTACIRFRFSPPILLSQQRIHSDVIYIINTKKQATTLVFYVYTLLIKNLLVYVQHPSLEFFQVLLLQSGGYVHALHQILYLPLREYASRHL